MPDDTIREDHVVTAGGEADMAGYEITEIGALDHWRDHFGGFAAARSRDGRRVVDHELAMQYIGLTANALEPGEEAGYWHTHSEVEELYVFLEGRGQTGLDDDLVDVGPGSVVRVGQGVWRTWRAHPESPGQLRWLCIRAGGGELPHLPNDATRDEETPRPMPWAQG
ncbi:cupin domain-containing protein [Microbacterium sp. KSW4-11]|uniref:Cupin domain-containing protein n=1 Tax=Microbacterium gawkjiense TaxID=3067309 RepID=A0ABU3G828_9MICO|nr:cupin domain-containing protein [Microbacterium sp. KSW4-11]MDT3315974.1 cupin domain-containing protein [Microbacterium sp. KSW4-11]